jgi:hypothetical protein
MQVNRYGVRAQAHWRTYHPEGSPAGTRTRAGRVLRPTERGHRGGDRPAGRGTGRPEGTGRGDRVPGPATPCWPRCGGRRAGRAGAVAARTARHRRRPGRQDPAGPARKGRQQVNHYGKQPLRHWRRHLSVSYLRLEDPVRFFTNLGEQADAEIEDRYLRYAGSEILGENAEDKQQRLTQAMNRATEEVHAGTGDPGSWPAGASRTRKRRFHRRASRPHARSSIGSKLPRDHAGRLTVPASQLVSSSQAGTEQHGGLPARHSGVNDRFVDACRVASLAAWPDGFCLVVMMYLTRTPRGGGTVPTPLTCVFSPGSKEITRGRSRRAWHQAGRRRQPVAVGRPAQADRHRGHRLPAEVPAHSTARRRTRSRYAPNTTSPQCRSSRWGPRRRPASG